MEIRLSKTLKDLRCKARKTQDELAAFLGISSQAISKWERSEGFPDITLLPKIASYFHVSVDELLGVDEIAKQEKIREITNVYNRIRHHIPLDPNHNLDEGIEWIRQAIKEFPGDFFFQQLLASDLSWKGKTISDQAEKIKLLEEAITLCEDILARSLEDRWRDAAKQILLATYAELGMKDKALEIAYQLPPPRCTREHMLTFILSGEELQKQQRENAVIFYQLFRESIQNLISAKVKATDVTVERELAIAGIASSEYRMAIESVATEMNSTQS